MGRATTEQIVHGLRHEFPACIVASMYDFKNVKVLRIYDALKKQQPGSIVGLKTFTIVSLLTEIRTVRG